MGYVFNDVFCIVNRIYNIITQNKITSVCGYVCVCFERFFFYESQIVQLMCMTDNER
jgi:hypothetical protein